MSKAQDAIKDQPAYMVGELQQDLVETFLATTDGVTAEKRIAAAERILDRSVRGNQTTRVKGEQVSKATWAAIYDRLVS